MQRDQDLGDGQQWTRADAQQDVRLQVVTVQQERRDDHREVDDQDGWGRMRKEYPTSSEDHWKLYDPDDWGRTRKKYSTSSDDHREVDDQDCCGRTR